MQNLMEEKKNDYTDIDQYTAKVDKHEQKNNHKHNNKDTKNKSTKENDPLLRKSSGSSTLSVRPKKSTRTSFEVSMGIPEKNSFTSDNAWTHPYLSHKRNQSMSTQRYNEQLLRSFRRYTNYNGCKFVLISIIVIAIAVERQLTLQQHYKHTSDCCFCYGAASENADIIFEWETCEYANNIKNVTSACNWHSPKLENLSTKYVRFRGGKWYFVITATIVFIIAFVYATVTFCISRTSEDVGILLRKMPLEFMLSYNVIISMICFYQILIDYQYYPSAYTYNDENKDCYVDALSRDAENVMFIILIVTFVHTFSPCIIVFPIHFFKNNCKRWKIFGCVELVYNFIILGSCGIITVSFLVIILVYTFHLLLPKFEWTVWILVLLVDIGLMTSFVDIYFFEIFKSSRNPFMNIFKIGCCCCYKICCNENEKQKSTYFQQFHTHSISGF